MSGAGIGRIDRRRRRHGQHGLRRMHEVDRQRRAAYNLSRGRFPDQTVAAVKRHRRAREQRDVRALRARRAAGDMREVYVTRAHP